MSQYDLLHRLQLFRDRGQPPGNHPQPLVGGRGSVRTSGGRTSPLTEAETSRVRRALFGPVDHAENLRFVKQELERGQREAEKRWNYDFVNDRRNRGEGVTFRSALLDNIKPSFIFYRLTKYINF